MANYNTHFSTNIPLNAEQCEEAQRLLALYTEYAEAKVNEEQFDGELSDEDKAFIERVETPEFEDSVGFEFDNDGDDVVISDDAGEPNLELAGRFVSALLDRFDINVAVGLEWGCTCSRPLPGGFGGGACVIKRDNVEWMNTDSWLSERIPGYGKEAEAAPAATPAP